MKPTTLYRLSGLALLLALPLQVLAGVLHPPSHAPLYLTSPAHLIAHTIDLVSWTLVLLGLPGLYARQANRAGALGLIGFVLAALNTVSHLDLLIYETFTAPLLARGATTQFLVAEDGPLSSGPLGIAITLPLLVLGTLLLSIATLRARALPRGAGWLSIAGLLVALGSVPLMVSGLFDLPPVTIVYDLIFLGYAWGGYALWTEKVRRHESEAQIDVPQPA